MKKTIRILTLVGVVGLMAGCAHVHSETETFDPAGHLTGRTKAGATTVFDANASLAKFRNTTGGTNGAGTLVNTLGEGSNGSNAVEVVKGIAQILNSLPK